MKLKLKYIVLVLSLLLITLFCIINISYSKYVLVDSRAGFHIDKIMEDKIKPTIIANDTEENKKNLLDERFYTNKDVIIEFYDNIKVNTAKYWYNEDNEIFEGFGKDFTNKTTFTNEGWYKIVITDIFDNTNTVIILIDKTAPIIYADSTNTSDTNLIRNAYSQENSNEFKQWFITDVSLSEYDKYGVKYTCYKVNDEEIKFTNITDQKENIGRAKLEVWTVNDKNYYLVTATDLCENTSTLVIGIDKVNPTITTLASSYVRQNKNIEVNYIDDFSGMKLIKYAYNPNSEKFNTYITLNSNKTLSDDGYYHFLLEDIAGNKNEYTVVVDKTAPVITLNSSEHGEEIFSNTSSTIIKESTDITLNTNDNFEIDYNEIWYNSSSNSFSGESRRFNNGEILKNEGYYKVTAHDSFGNTTTIIILLDKTPPEIKVTYHKKSEISLIDIFDRNGGIC